MSGTGQDLFNSITPVHDVAVAAKTTTVTSTGVDRTAYQQGAARVVAVIDIDAATDGTWTPKLQDSPDNSTWTDVVSPFIQGPTPATFTSANANSEVKLGYLGVQRYVRCVVTATGVTTGIVFGILWIVSYEQNYPAT
jgi:hypothetical protein